MTLEEFAEKAGCVVELNPEPEGWGGKWQWHSVDHPNCYYAGYRTEKSAYKAFIEQAFGKSAGKAVIALLKKTEKNT